jgi:competence protein ComEC
MSALNHIRLHVVDVDHGDAMILELPDYDGRAHFGIVDTGRPETRYRSRLADYLDHLVSLRGLADDWAIEFVCVTHPHEDHYGGLSELLDRHLPRIRQFWDCGFRTAAATYNNLLQRIADADSVAYLRLASGFEIELGPVRIAALAPSLDLRIRFDTYGVDRNNASVILQVTFRNSIAVLAGDAFFDSWGKVAEEFPRVTKITYFKDAQVDRSEGTNQLNCQLLKVSHHGSKHGTSLEYLEKLNPTHFMITCADPTWYQSAKPGWGTSWPHPLTVQTIAVLRPTADVRTSASDGNVIYELKGTRRVSWQAFKVAPDDPAFPGELGQRI